MGTEPPRGLSEEVWSCQTAVFSLLERARLTSDFELAALAHRRLLELGVAVLFQPANRVEISDAASSGRRSRTADSRPDRSPRGHRDAPPDADAGGKGGQA